MPGNYLIPHPQAGDRDDNRNGQAQMFGTRFFAHPASQLGAGDGADNQGDGVGPDDLAGHRFADGSHDGA